MVGGSSPPLGAKIKPPTKFCWRFYLFGDVPQTHIFSSGAGRSQMDTRWFPAKGWSASPVSLREARRLRRRIQPREPTKVPLILGGFFYTLRGLRTKRILALTYLPMYHLNVRSNDYMSNRNQIKKELKEDKAILSCAQQFGLVGNPTRMKICWLLCKHPELSVSEIAEMLNVSVSVVSHSLKRLRSHKLVDSRRNHKQVYYSLSGSNFNKILKKSLTNI